MTDTADTIVALSSGRGGALAVIRLSGERAIDICDAVFRSRSGMKLSEAAGYTLHYGNITDGDRAIDDVVVSLFRAPRSYTGEDMAEISCHGSQYIVSEIINLTIRHGARYATAGEFTIRAFMAGKLDLIQAEAIADMISSTDRATHAVAINQMRGGYSAELAVMRGKLIELVSLIELELDFGEEDVQFADRGKLNQIISDLQTKIEHLRKSFSLGNVIKEGVAVAIVGAPNVGKSTLMNALLNDDRAIVSDIPGTTRDVIEESLRIGDLQFRFLDTAGLRHTGDSIEQMGIERTRKSIERANIILYVVDASANVADGVEAAATEIRRYASDNYKQVCLILNKTDKTADIESIIAAIPLQIKQLFAAIIPVSAQSGVGVDAITRFLGDSVDTSNVYDGSVIVSNSRHYEALGRAAEALDMVSQGIESGITSDLLAQDIREALYHLGTITGEVTTDEILGSIFQNFCIGK